jgi:hypothetical protein
VISNPAPSGSRVGDGNMPPGDPPPLAPRYATASSLASARIDGIPPPPRGPPSAVCTGLASSGAMPSPNPCPASSSPTVAYPPWPSPPPPPPSKLPSKSAPVAPSPPDAAVDPRNPPPVPARAFDVRTKCLNCLHSSFMYRTLSKLSTASSSSAPALRNSSILLRISVCCSGV